MGYHKQFNFRNAAHSGLDFRQGGAREVIAQNGTLSRKALLRNRLGNTGTPDFPAYDIALGLLH